MTSTVDVRGALRTKAGMFRLIALLPAVTALLVGLAYRWSVGTWLLGLLGSIVPLSSVILLIRADRTGRLGVPAIGEPAANVPRTA